VIAWAGGVKRQVVLFYLLMLAAHAAHVIEETVGGFWLKTRVFGLGWFLAGNTILFVIPIVVLILFLHGSIWGWRGSVLYAMIMTANGLGHNLGWAITGRYHGGFAGAYTGIALAALGPPLFYYLMRFRKSARQGLHLSEE
jgi:hypothetical protein